MAIVRTSLALLLAASCSAILGQATRAEQHAAETEFLLEDQRLAAELEETSNPYELAFQIVPCPRRSLLRSSGRRPI